MADIKESHDVGMVQGGRGPGFLLEAAQSLGVGRRGSGQDLDCDVAAQARIAGAVDLSHPAGAERPRIS